MKIKLLFLLVALQLTYLHAQLEKGKWMVGLETKGGYAKSIEEPPPNVSTTYPRVSNLDIGVLFSKVLGKNNLFGLGIRYQGNWTLFTTSTGGVVQSEVKLNSNIYMLQLYYGKMKFISKNLYLNSGVKLGIGTYDDKYNKNTLGLNTEINFKPLEIGYCFKNRFLLQANLFQWNFIYQTKNTSQNTQGKYSDSYFKLNPFQNSFSITYILNHSKSNKK